jgi:hypothetical protein
VGQQPLVAVVVVCCRRPPPPQQQQQGLVKVNLVKAVKLGVTTATGSTWSCHLVAMGAAGMNGWML